MTRRSEPSEAPETPGPGAGCLVLIAFTAVIWYLVGSGIYKTGEWFGWW